MNKITRLAAAVVLSGLLLAAPAAQAAPALLGASANFELEVNEMELEITADDPRPKAYLYTGGQSDYYFIVWMSSNPTVASVDGDGRVTGRSAGEATITAITDRGECAACKVTVRKESGNAASKKPALDHTTLNLVIQYNNAHPSHLQVLRHDRRDDGFLVVEIVIDVAGAHAGGLRDLRDAGAVEAVLAETLCGGVQDLLAARGGTRGIGGGGGVGEFHAGRICGERLAQGESALAMK